MLKKTLLAPLFAAVMMYGVPAIAVGPNWSPPNQTQTEDLLPPEQAFRLLAEVKGPDKIRLEYSIAPGYYLYRKRFSFGVSTPGYALGAPGFPKGEIIHDEYFGDVEIYRNQLIIELPYQRKAGTPAGFELTANSQGCADVGVCYQPYSQTVPLQAAAP
jgi:thiol:disulfide interchange protein DsbD